MKTTDKFTPPVSRINAEFLVKKHGKEISALNKKLVKAFTFHERLSIKTEIDRLTAKYNFYKHYYDK